MTAKTNSKKYLSYIALTMLAIALFSNSGMLYAQGEIDIIEPSDVENLKATPGDSQIKLTWDAAKDNIGVTGYKIYRGTKSVKNPDDIYDLPAIPLANLTTYDVKNLTNGQKYFFTVTAIDGAGNESISYAIEAQATPSSDEQKRDASIEDNAKAPEVKKVEAKDGLTVLVEFSEPVWLPQESPKSAFKIRKTSNEAQLVVEKAEIYSEDKTGATILLTTAPQEKGAEYEVTVGFEIQDYYDNPLISGTSDTGVFNGKEAPTKSPPPEDPKDKPSADTDAPRVISAVADFNDRITVSMSEAVVLPPNAKDSVMIVSKKDGSKLAVKTVSASVDGKLIFVTTATQMADDYEVKLTKFKDIAGNEINSAGASWTVSGNAPRQSGIQDLIPPEDVTKLVAKLKNAQENVVELKWQHSADSAKDLSDYLFAQGSGKNSKKIGVAVSVGASANSLDVKDLAPGQWYTFKISAKDASGNESNGTFANFYLPQTGPGMLAAGITSLLMGWKRRKKNKKLQE